MRNIHPRLNIAVYLLCLLFSLSSFAQDADTESDQKDIDFVEKLLEQKSNEFKNAPTKVIDPAQKKQKAEYSTVQSESFYADLAVIQKNYMPKTERVQLYGGFTLLPTDVFFRTMGLNIKTSYHINETWGLEAFGYFLSSQDREEIGQLRSKQGLDVQNLVSLSSYYGLNVYFNSMYGKTAFLNDRIIPFEIYQTLGLGKVRTQNGDDANSFQVGIGDIFSLTRSSALRLDLTWAFYTAKNYRGEDQASNSIFLTLSYGHLFPEPSYR